MNQNKTEEDSNPKSNVSFWKRFLFFRALKKGNTFALKKLLRNGLNPNGLTYYGMSPVSLAVKYQNPSIVEILLEFSADPNQPDETTGLTPLIHSVLEDSSPEILSLLVLYGADLNRKDSNGMSPLHHCVNEGKLSPFRILLEKGADPNVQDFDGVTCMNLAKSSHGMSEFAELLLKHGADPMIKDKHGKIYLM
ncbi:ankyrin repeat domain-containing protein [Leptospira sp. 201903071]|uniref:ankyrin repeat domain-containing protein n=1 Tax=Leptospira ainazelensis TaxID=2810034 RepID=UPI001962EB0C|nr:ankyrin repeat domain-containing protein [Leptospira ainazelensis]MBM9501032.1 ankyrin repeat domain-containing protein [Leptospira ainazelensis]